MAVFQTKTLTKHDDHMTPKYVREWIEYVIPKDKVIWEAFYGNGDSGAILTNLDVNVIHEEIALCTNHEGDVIVSNPPFSEEISYGAIKRVR